MSQPKNEPELLLTCQHCGDAFYATDSDAVESDEFCSATCEQEAQEAEEEENA